MAGGRSSGGFEKAYTAYSAVLEALGHALDTRRLACQLTEDERERAGLMAVMDGADRSVRIPPRVRQAMDALLADLCRQLRDAAGLPDVSDATELAARLAGQDAGSRDRLADVVAQGSQGALLRERHMTADAFRKLLRKRKDAGKLALDRLVPWMCEQFRARGCEVSEEVVRGLFGDGEDDVQVPYCAGAILGGVNGQFRAGLIPLADMVGDSDPDEWLEEARKRLRFRSHSSMHKAIAAATSLKYDCVHKSLSGKKKAKRIQAEIRYCLEAWLNDVEEGREPDIDDMYRGVPVERMGALLPELAKRFGTKEQIYRAVSAKTGIKSGSVRRYFQSCGQLRCAPLVVYRAAEELARSDAPPPPVPRAKVRRRRLRSYLADNRTRKLASGLARQLADARSQLLAGGRDEAELECSFRDLRLRLIMTLKSRGRQAVRT